MPIPPWKPRTPEGTRGRILDLLRRERLTANQIAEKLGLTHNAVRLHLAALQGERLVREGGLQRGASRPAAVYELVPRADAALSRAYIPFIAHLLRLLGERLSPDEMDELMRSVGAQLASEWPRPRGSLRQRVDAASAFLDELGALTYVEERGRGFVMRGYGCLLGEAVHGRPEVCHAMESLVAELVREPVRECCQRGEHPRCCFEVGPAAEGGEAES